MARLRQARGPRVRGQQQAAGEARSVQARDRGESQPCGHWSSVRLPLRFDLELTLTQSRQTRRECSRIAPHGVKK